ncbi:hypothetical protein [Thiolapillus sp.]
MLLRLTACALLLHGLGRNTQAMRYLQYRLERAGFEVFNIMALNYAPVPQLCITL